MNRAIYGGEIGNRVTAVEADPGPMSAFAAGPDAAFCHYPSSAEGQAYPVVGSRRRETGTAKVRFARFNDKPDRPELGDVVEKVGLRKRLEPMVRKQTLPSSIDSSPPIDLAQRFIATTENYGARLFQRYRPSQAHWLSKTHAPLM